MGDRMKKTAYIAVIFILLYALTACRRPSENSKSPEVLLQDKDETKYTVGFIAGMGGMGDKSYNDIMFKGLISSRKSLGIDIKYKIPHKPEDHKGFMEELISQGCNVIIAGGGWYSVDPVDNLSLIYPDVLFVLIDDYAKVYRENVCSVTFRQNEGSFLAGLLASRMSRNARIAVIAATDAEVIRDFIAGFKAGAEYADKQTSLFIRYIDHSEEVPDPFQHPESAYRIAEELILEHGVDVLFQVAGGSGTGVFNAARDYGRYAIGVDSDQDYLAQGTILASMMKNMDTAIIMIIKKIAGGSFENRPYMLGLEDKGVSLSPMTYTRDIIPDDVIKELKLAEQKIISGEIQVPSVY